MAIDVETLGAARSYVDETMQGAGALKGQDGKDGKDGKSPYDIACDNGYEGTEQEWLDSLKGADGKDGLDGKDGSGDKNIIESISVNGISVTPDKNKNVNIVTLSEESLKGYQEKEVLFPSSSIDGEPVVIDNIYAYLIEYCNNQFVALGNGITHVSTDGVQWEWFDNDLLGSTMSALKYAFGKYMVISGSRIYYSEDLITWTASDVYFNSFTIERFYYVEDEKVLFAIGINGYGYTLDGETWNIINVRDEFQIENQILTIMYNDEEYLMFVEGGLIYSSTDYLNWKIKTTPGNAIRGDSYSSRFAHGRGIYLSYNDMDNRQLYYSYNLTAWEKSNISLNTRCRQLSYFNGLFICYDGNSFHHSKNGIDWSDAIDVIGFSLNEPIDNNFTFGKDKLVFLSNGEIVCFNFKVNNKSLVEKCNENEKEIKGLAQRIQSISPSNLLMSTDTDILYIPELVKNDGFFINDMAYSESNSEFYAVGETEDGRGFFATSTDGINWNLQRTIEEPLIKIAVGDTGMLSEYPIMISSSKIYAYQWGNITDLGFPLRSASPLCDVIYYPDTRRYLVISGDYIYWSTSEFDVSAGTWEFVQYTNQPTTHAKIEYINDVFIIAGQGTAVYRASSEDLHNWSTVFSGRIYNMFILNDRFYLSEGNVLHSSEDGWDWIPEDIYELSIYPETPIYYDNNMVIVVNGFVEDTRYFYDLSEIHMMRDRLDEEGIYYSMPTLRQLPNLVENFATMYFHDGKIYLGGGYSGIFPFYQKNENCEKIISELNSTVEDLETKVSDLESHIEFIKMHIGMI